MSELGVCPNCGAEVAVPRQIETVAAVRCASCGWMLYPTGRRCPYCGTVYAAQTEICATCGAGLIRRCPECDTPNWLNDTFCVGCGATLDLMGIVLKRETATDADRLYTHSASVSEVKAVEQTAAQERLNRMLAEERNQRAELHRRLQERKRKEQQVLVVVIAVACVILAVIAILSLTGGS